MVGKHAFIAVYILASGRNGTLYVGVTSKLGTRVEQHKSGTFEGFSKRYGCKTLVWYERHETMLEAIWREKQIKRWRRDWKLALIEAENPEWRDLSEVEAPDGPLSWMQRRRRRRVDGGAAGSRLSAPCERCGRDDEEWGAPYRKSRRYAASGSSAGGIG